MSGESATRIIQALESPAPWREAATDGLPLHRTHRTPEGALPEPPQVAGDAEARITPVPLVCASWGRERGRCGY